MRGTLGDLGEATAKATGKPVAFPRRVAAGRVGL